MIIAAFDCGSLAASGAVLHSDGKNAVPTILALEKWVFSSKLSHNRRLHLLYSKVSDMLAAQLNIHKLNEVIVEDIFVNSFAKNLRAMIKVAKCVGVVQVCAAKHGFSDVRLLTAKQVRGLAGLTGVKSKDSKIMVCDLISKAFGSQLPDFDLPKKLIPSKHADLADALLLGWMAILNPDVTNG